MSRITGDYIDGEIEVPSCPACGGPAQLGGGDAASYNCLVCEWNGDGWASAAPDYPDSPRVVQRFGRSQLTGGMVGKLRFQRAPRWAAVGDTTTGTAGETPTSE